MPWRLALASLVVAAMARGAAANGRPPATVSINFRAGQDREVAVGLTFGLVISHDGGKTWGWVCENAIGYQGTYDPHYTSTPSGALFASTYAGLKVMRNGCTFDATPAGATFVSANALGPDQAFYYAAAQTEDKTTGTVADFAIYRSTDDGATFKPTATDAAKVSWWQSMLVSAKDPKRIYLTGYAYVPDVPKGTKKQPLLYRSDDAGASWIAIALDSSVQVMANSALDIVGIVTDKAGVEHVYLRVESEDNNTAESIYKSTDRGVTWTAINHKSVAIGGFVARAALNAKGQHDLVVTTVALGAEVSHDDGGSWETLTNAPHMNCLAESAAGELWACTQNYGVNGSPKDDAGVMKTTDLATWTKVLRYQELTDAVACTAGTPQQDACVPMWCAVCAQLGCTPSASYNCPAPTEVVVTHPPATGKPGGGGCCDAGPGSGAGALALGLVIGTVVLRPRRRQGW
jgi:uncharacterized protein (TIGR03382 family)